MESRVFTIGAWSNFEEMEDSITLDELLAINESMDRADHELFRKMAMTQGANVPSYDELSAGVHEDGLTPSERVLNRVQSKLTGGASEYDGLFEIETE